jgi:hypothetical protein
LHGAGRGVAQPIVQQLFSHAGQALPHTFETRLENRHGHLHLEVTLTGLDYQDEHYLCATARDISQRHHAARQQRLAAGYSNPAMKPF